MAVSLRSCWQVGSFVTLLLLAAGMAFEESAEMATVLGLALLLVAGQRIGRRVGSEAIDPTNTTGRPSAALSKASDG